MEKKYIHQEVSTGADTIAHLKLYDGSAFDYSLNNNYGTLKGTAHYTYPGVDLDGDSDYIEIADATVFSPLSTSISISAWIYMDRATYFPIASKMATDKDEWNFYVESEQLIFQIHDDSTETFIGRFYNFALSTGSWLHVTGTYENDASPASADIKLYLNGVNVDDTDSENDVMSFTEVENLSQPVWIGREGGNFANGKIDDVIITKSVLSATEVRSIYELTRWRYQV